VPAEVTSVERVTPRHVILQLACESVAQAAQPGQFLHVRVSPAHDPLLRRPLSIMKVLPHTPHLEILVQEVGRGSELLAQAVPGQRFDVMGPLGNTFPLPASEERAILVAGGVGVAPLVFLADKLGLESGSREIWGLLGGQTESLLCCWLELASRSHEFWAATEDGSIGERGLVTDLLRHRLDVAAGPSRIYACGPQGMLSAVAQIAEEYDVPAWVSLERWMGCGVGACLGCVVRSARPDTPAYVRVCKDGPVFSITDLDWSEA
jgi:dihydroorotate dehydrogenase electron transfer subunit